MKTFKLVSGILSIVLFAAVSFQSCAASLSSALSESSEVSGIAGQIVALLVLSGGIVSISTRNSEKKGGDTALIVLFSFAALVGFTLAGSFSDLRIWAAWCLFNAVMAVISMRKKGTVK